MNDVNYALTVTERDTIQELFEKKLALENLAKIISPDENPKMYDRLVADYGITVRQFNDWWTLTTKAHHLPPAEYIVDFENYQLIPNDQR